MLGAGDVAAGLMDVGQGAPVEGTAARAQRRAVGPRGSGDPNNSKYCGKEGGNGA